MKRQLLLTSIIALALAGCMSSTQEQTTAPVTSTQPLTKTEESTTPSPPPTTMPPDVPETDTVEEDELPPPREPAEPSLRHVCGEEEKRLDVCAQVYEPVCGNDGETYSNACEACTSGNVESYLLGACPDAEELEEEVDLPTTTPIDVVDLDCNSACLDRDYLGGTCRISSFACQRRNEISLEERLRLCDDVRDDVCCCRTPDSVAVNTSYYFNVGGDLEAY